MKKKEKNKKKQTEKTSRNFLTLESVIHPVAFEDNSFLFRDGTIMDIMEIKAKDLENLGEMETQIDFLKHQKFHKTNSIDYKIIAMNYPCDYTEQIEYYKEKLERTRNPYQKKWLERTLNELIWLEKNKTKREYYVMFYPESKNEHDEFVIRNLQDMGVGKDKLLKEMPQQKKVQIMFKLGNQNMHIR